MFTPTPRPIKRAQSPEIVHPTHSSYCPLSNHCYLLPSEEVTEAINAQRVKKSGREKISLI
jgi:hypothetical protein